MSCCFLITFGLRSIYFPPLLQRMLFMACEISPLSTDKAFLIYYIFKKKSRANLQSLSFGRVHIINQLIAKQIFYSIAKHCYTFI